MGSKDEKYFTNNPNYWNGVSEKLGKKKCIATPKFVRTVMHFSTTAFQKLKMNAYMMSVMADCPCVSGKDDGKNIGDERDSELKDRCLHLIVEKLKSNNKYKLICPGTGNETMTKLLKEIHKLTKDNYAKTMD